MRSGPLVALGSRDFGNNSVKSTAKGTAFGKGKRSTPLKIQGDDPTIERVLGEFHKSSCDGGLIEAATVLLPTV